MSKTLLIFIFLISIFNHANGAVRLTDGHVSSWPDKYDRYFKKYSKRYFGPQFNWRWFKAQGVAESNLKNKVKSSVGAVGIMQIMPLTFGEIKKKNPHFTHLEDPQWNIAAGIFYDRLIYRKIRKPITSQHKLLFTFAGYNAGYGRVLKAFKRSKNLEWNNVKQNLPGETRFYVNRIIKLMQNAPAKQKGIQKFLVKRDIN